MVIKGGAIYRSENEILEPENSLDFETDIPPASIEIVKRDPSVIIVIYNL